MLQSEARTAVSSVKVSCSRCQCIRWPTINTQTWYTAMDGSMLTYIYCPACVMKRAMLQLSRQQQLEVAQEILEEEAHLLKEASMDYSPLETKFK